ncbi:MAG: formylglycine-generating enzyme family protein, partial [Acidobacteria bacterium]|nr:formylglycine-generating enzyme family protein [Acidobacteriota bacterium]
MVIIPGGSVQVGSPTAEGGRSSNEGPPRQVSIAGFAIGKHEVTQAQWRAVMGTNPSFFIGDNLPVEQVSWDDAREFCRRLNAQLGLTESNGYRLPSEAEWEYAARAGTTTPFAFGATINADIVNYFGPSPYGNAPTGILRNRTVNTGSLGVANGWGLFDLHGNVAEWCEDDYHSSYVGAPADGRPWVEVVRLANRIIRGGSWNEEAVFSRSASRGRAVPGSRNYGLGLRLARTLPYQVPLPNRTPLLTVPSGHTVSVGQRLSFTVAATDVDPGQTLTLTTGSLPAGAVFTQSGAVSGQFNWTPVSGQTGNYTLSFTVADNGLPPLAETRTCLLYTS